MGTGNNQRGPRCIVCERSAGFLTPIGLMCGHHALEYAAHTAPDADWLPIRIQTGPDHDPHWHSRTETGSNEDG